jgi:hypothetical protein
VNGLKLYPYFYGVINSSQPYSRKSTLHPSQSGANNFDMSKAICIAVVLLGVCVTLTLRLTNGYQAADLAAAVPTGFAKARPPLERDEPIVVNSSAKSDQLIATLPPEITIGISEPGRIAPVADSKPAAVQAPITSWHWHEGSKKVTRK